MVMISIQKMSVIGSLALLFCLEASADTEAVTKDGRHLILKDNKTWEYIQFTDGGPSKSAVISVINVEDLGSN
jgi:hypothetical protein